MAGNDAKTPGIPVLGTPLDFRNLHFIDRERLLIKFLDLQQSGAPKADIQEVEKQIALTFKEAGKLSQQFNKIKEVAKHLFDSAAFQNIRLKDRVIADNRDKPKVEHDKPEIHANKPERHRDMELVKGRLVASKEKNEFEGFYANRANLGQAGSETRNATRSVIERILSSFERLLIERFENGAVLVREHADGKPEFSGKTAGEWSDFFAAFADRSVAKKFSLADVRDFLFRGLVMKGDKGVVIADAQFANGKVEKFVRFQALEDLLQQLKSLQPGQSFSKEMFKNLTGEELMVLALAASQGGGLEFSPQVAKGKFMLAGSTEERASQELGIALHEKRQQQQMQKASRKGRGGIFSWRDHDREVWEDSPQGFVPWWAWGKLPRKEKTESVRSLFYFALIITALIGIIALTMRFF